MSSLSNKEEVERAKKKLEEYYDVKAIKKIDYMLKIKVERIKNRI